MSEKFLLFVRPYFLQWFKTSCSESTSTCVDAAKSTSTRSNVAKISRLREVYFSSHRRENWRTSIYVVWHRRDAPFPASLNDFCSLEAFGPQRNEALCLEIPTLWSLENRNFSGSPSLVLFTVTFRYTVSIGWSFPIPMSTPCSATFFEARLTTLSSSHCPVK